MGCWEGDHGVSFSPWSCELACLGNSLLWRKTVKTHASTGTVRRQMWAFLRVSVESISAGSHCGRPADEPWPVVLKAASSSDFMDINI